MSRRAAGLCAVLALGGAGAALAQEPAAPFPDFAITDEAVYDLPGEPPPALAEDGERPGFERAYPPIRWRSSVAVGLPYAGRLRRGVQLPAEGADFFTWDPIRDATPNRDWRRHGTDHLVRTILRVLADHRRAHPDAPRVGIGDLSRPRGGPFGRRFGGLGHLSHQNGLDVDIYYPRTDGRERPPARVSQIDHRLAQDLVSRFARAGATHVFVGWGTTRLRGRRGIVSRLAHHDDHLHVRLRKPR